MFGLGFFEIILILAGILVFIRPQDLPAFVYRVGKVYGQFKEMYTKFWREANILKNQIDEMVEKETKNITEVSKEANSSHKSIDEIIASSSNPSNKDSASPERETIGQQNPFMPSPPKTTPKTTPKKSTKKSIKGKSTPTQKLAKTDTTNKNKKTRVKKLAIAPSSPQATPKKSVKNKSTPTQKLVKTNTTNKNKKTSKKISKK